MIGIIKQHWGKALACLVGLTAVCLGPAFAYQAAERLSGSATFAIAVSLCGLVVSAVGFPLALIQLARTKKAAVAAKEAVDTARDAWAKYDVRNEISRSLTYARVALEHVSNAKWDSAINGMVEFNLSLSRVSALGRGISSEDIEAMRNEMAELVTLIDAFEAEALTGPSQKLLKRSKSRLRKQLGLLTEIEIRFQEAVQ